MKYMLGKDEDVGGMMTWLAQARLSFLLSDARWKIHTAKLDEERRLQQPTAAPL